MHEVNENAFFKISNLDCDILQRLLLFLYFLPILSLFAQALLQVLTILLLFFGTNSMPQD